MSHSRVGASKRRLAPRTEPEDLKLDAFARLIGEKLAEALNRRQFDRLAIAAAPGVMGLLREHLTTAVRATIWLEIDKDFAQLPLDKLDKVLEPHLYP